MSRLQISALTTRSAGIVFLIVAAIGFPTIAAAQTNAEFDLSWHSINGGGVSFSQSAEFQLGGTIGQVGAEIMQDSNFVLYGGFWVPDDELTADCNSNGVEDADDLTGGTSQDCDTNGAPDDCQLQDNDCNANQVPDQCESGLAPAIDTQPQDQNLCEGDTAMFSVGATGSGQLGYQWRVDGQDIQNGTDYFLTFGPVTASDAGVYDVVVTDDCGTLTSATARLSVNIAPEISPSPQSQTVCEGASVTLTVGATGDNLVYQWRRDGVGIGGQTANSYQIASAAVADGGTYDVVVENECGVAISDAATLFVWEAGSGDVNGDGFLDGLDIPAFIEVYLDFPNGPAGLAFCAADLNADNTVNLTDLGLYVALLLGS